MCFENLSFCLFYNTAISAIFRYKSCIISLSLILSSLRLMGTLGTPETGMRQYISRSLDNRRTRRKFGYLLEL